MRRRIFSGLMATALVTVCAVPALAQSQPEGLGTFKAWTAWKANDGYGAMCFVSAAPEDSSPKTGADGKPLNRDPANFLVLHREKAPAINADGTAAKDASGAQVFRKARNEVQTLVGYPMRPSSVTSSMTRRVGAVLLALLVACGGGDKKEKTTPDKKKDEGGQSMKDTGDPEAPPTGGTGTGGTGGAGGGAGSGSNTAGAGSGGSPNSGEVASEPSDPTPQSRSSYPAASSEIAPP